MPDSAAGGISGGSELRSLSLEVARLGERVRLLEAGILRIDQLTERTRKGLEEVMKADEIATAVAAQLDRKERRHTSQLSSAWVKLGIASLIFSTVVSTAGIILSATGGLG